MLPSPNLFTVSVKYSVVVLVVVGVAGVVLLSLPSQPNKNMIVSVSVSERKRFFKGGLTD